MINTESVLARWLSHRDALGAPVRRVSLAKAGLAFDDKAYILGVVNFSRDSSYRETVAYSVDDAIRKVHKQYLDGASIVDIGAESSFGNHVDGQGQLEVLKPTVERLAALGIPTSIDTYQPDTVAGVLEAGADVINLSGRDETGDIYRLVARHNAGLILCYTAGKNAREVEPLPSRDALIETQFAFFREQLTRATAAGCDCIWIDPGIGFPNLLRENGERIAFQIENLLECFRFRVLGWPIAMAIPASLALFQEEVRAAEPSLAALTMLSKANLIRVHEVGALRPLLACQDLPPIW